MPRSRIAAPGLFLWGHVIARRHGARRFISPWRGGGIVPRDRGRMGGARKAAPLCASRLCAATLRLAGTVGAYAISVLSLLSL